MAVLEDHREGSYFNRGGVRPGGGSCKGGLSGVATYTPSGEGKVSFPFEGDAGRAF